MGYVAKEYADQADGFTIEVLGNALKATPLPQPLFDPEAKVMRAP